MGPKRSVFTHAESCPKSTRAVATASTRGVGPQTKMRGRSLEYQALRPGGLGHDFDDLAEAPGDPPVGLAHGTGLRRHPLIPPVALLSPGVPVVVVAQGLPEARVVVGSKLQPPHPLGALPEVQVRHEQAGRSAVLWLKGLPLVGKSHPSLA